MKGSLRFALSFSALLTGVVRGDTNVSCRPDFLSGQSYAVPGAAVTLSTADLNGDGLPDMATTSNYYGYAVSVRLGKPDGTFGAQINKPTNTQTLSAVIGNFTNDPVPDLVESGYGGLSFYKGNGDGSFQDVVPFAGPSLFGLAPADFNGDGKLDVVGVDNYTGQFNVFLGNGDGTFQAAIVTTPKETVAAIAVGDVNGDGKPDLVGSSLGSDIFVYLGLGDGNFASPTSVVAGSGLGAIVLSDVSGDGHLDVLVTSNVAASVAVLIGNGDGTFQTALNYGSGIAPQGLVVADFNGDGAPDIAALEGPGGFGGTGSVEILLNVGNGTFVTRAHYLGTISPIAGAAADFGNDGHADLALGDASSSTVMTIRGNGDGTFNAVVVTLTEFAPVTMTAGDFNEDGIPDVVLGGASSIQTYFATAGGTFAAGPQSQTNGSIFAAAAGDFNNDGHLDMAVLLNYGPQVGILLGNGDGTFGPITLFLITPNYTNYAAFAIGDFDGGGSLDVAVVYQNYDYTSFLAVLIGAGDGTLGPAIQTPVTENGIELLAADLNGDGRADLAMLNQYPSDHLDIFLSAGGGSFGPPTQYTVANGARGMAAADLRHTGHLDLVVGGTSTNTISLFPGDGSGTFGNPSILGVGAPVNDIAVADVNGDGNLDLVTANLSANASVLLGLGTGAFQSPKDYPVGTPFAVALGDFAGSGRPDAVFGNSSIAGITVLLNGALGAAVPDASALVGSPATIQAFASGYGALTYQWRRNGTPLSDGGTVSGATTATLTIDPAAFSDAASYDVLVTDSCGTIASSVGSLSVEFADVPVSNIFHTDILTIATAGITAGCGGADYCPSALVTRAQMAVFLLKSEHGSAYAPPACAGLFADVPCPSTYANWIEQLSNEGVTAGCGNGDYCPDASITRAQMAVFLLKTSQGSAYVPPAATAIFDDVPVGAFADAFIDDLYTRGIAGGCSSSPLLYCPNNVVNRAQMAALLVNTFF